MTGPRPVCRRPIFKLGVKKVGLSGKEFYVVIQELRSWPGLLVQRVFCKVISEIKNGLATDLH